MNFDSNLYDDLEPVEIKKIDIEKISINQTAAIPGRTNDANTKSDTQDEEEETELADVADVQQCKLFVGGLKWTTTSPILASHFSKFGKIIACDVVMDPITMKSRGFGFVTFSTRAAVDLVLRQEHVIDGKMVDPKRSVLSDKPDIIAKLFVGGIPQDATDEMLSTFFSKWGKILNASITTDQSTGRSRGFGFVTFDSLDDLEDCLDSQARQKLQINSKTVDVRKAVGRKNNREREVRDDRSERSSVSRDERSVSASRGDDRSDRSYSRDRHDGRDRVDKRDGQRNDRDRFQDRLGTSRDVDRRQNHKYRNRSRSPRRQPYHR